MNQLERVAAIDQMTGQTPLLRIDYCVEGVPGEVFAKYESENMTGSIKDRMAIHTLRSGVPEELEDVVVKALQKDPDNRFQNGQARSTADRRGGVAGHRPAPRAVRSRAAAD